MSVVSNSRVYWVGFACCIVQYLIVPFILCVYYLVYVRLIHLIRAFEIEYYIYYTCDEYLCKHLGRNECVAFVIYG